MTFFSLRGWGKHKSGVLTTEQVYIHGKTCIIDDRKSSSAPEHHVVSSSTEFVTDI